MSSFSVRLWGNEREIWKQGYRSEAGHRTAACKPDHVVTDPQTSTTTHWHALVFIRGLVKERMKTAMKHSIKKPQLSERWGRSNTIAVGQIWHLRKSQWTWACISPKETLCVHLCLQRAVSGWRCFKSISLKWCYLLCRSSTNTALMHCILQITRGYWMAKEH